MIVQASTGRPSSSPVRPVYARYPQAMPSLLIELKIYTDNKEMFLPPTTVKAGINRHLGFLQLDKDTDHHQCYHPIKNNDDTYKHPYPTSSIYYLQHETAFKPDIYNSKRSYEPLNYDDWFPMYAEKLPDRKLNVMYQSTPISEIPRKPIKVHRP